MDALNSLIKFRCEKKLLARAKRIADKRERDFADWLRRVFEKYLDAQEKELGLPPITAAEVSLLTKPKRTRRPRNKGPNPAKSNLDAEVAAVTSPGVSQSAVGVGAAITPEITILKP